MILLKKRAYRTGLVWHPLRVEKVCAFVGIQPHILRSITENA